MSNKRIRRFLPQLVLIALALPIFAGWTGAVNLRAGNGNHALASPDLSAFAHNLHGDSDVLQQAGSKSATRLEKMPQGMSVTGVGSVQAQTFQPVTSTGSFANPAFQRIWERTDRPVASGAVKRSWYWGPVPNTGGLQEDYAEGAGGKRLVQYFDKSRMEINNPAGDPNNPFFVTNGLLTVELISGKMQTGNSTYVDRYPADIALASDPDDANAPTYLSFQGVANTPLGEHPASSRLAQLATSTITRNGTVGDDPTKATYPKVNIIFFEQTTRHNIPLAIWEFLNETGPVYDPATGKTGDARLSNPWFYATGYPISEPYWAKVKIAGEMQDVLIQAFERRVVTYVPNGVPGFKVQMGNIGQHYYDWRYRDAGKPQVTATPVPNATAVPTATRPAQLPTATTVADPNADCSGIPAQQNMVVTPECGPGGTSFSFTGSGFQPGETVSIYLTLPDQQVYEAPFQRDADGNGRVAGIGLNSDRTFPPGIWGITMEGLTTHNKAIGRFKITSPGPTPTRGPAGTCNAPPSVNGEVTPNSGRQGDTLQITVRGFQPGESATYWFTRPDNEVLYGAEPLPGSLNRGGVIGPLPYEIDADDAQHPGVWALTVRGDSSGHQAIIYYCITP